MLPSIFGKALDDVTYADVVTFCQQKPKEGLGLDYKKDLSSLPNVVKTLVSFANTNGGWLIVGVEDENDAPKLPAKGMSYEENTIQKINNSIISTVSPVVSPFYKECLSGDKKSMFLIVHMPQSQSAPHMMSYKNRNALFIRVADHTTGQDWEEQASGSQWEMLRNRRQASVDLRNQLLTMMKDVYEARASAEDEVELASQRAQSLLPTGFMPLASYFEGAHYDKSQVVTILPSYPNTQITDIGTIKHAITDEPISNSLHDYHSQTPNHLGYDTKVFQNGAYAFHKEDRTKRYYFFGADVFGNIMNVDPIEKSRQHPQSNDQNNLIHFVSLTWIIALVAGALLFANKVYSKVGLVGNLILRVEFSGTKNCRMYFPIDGSWAYNEENPSLNPTGEYVIQREVNTTLLSNKEAMVELLSGIVKEVLYSFNYSYIEEDKLRTLILKALRTPDLV